MVVRGQHFADSITQQIRRLRHHIDRADQAADETAQWIEQAGGGFEGDQQGRQYSQPDEQVAGAGFAYEQCLDATPPVV